MKILYPLIATCLLTGCAVGPDFSTPILPDHAPKSFLSKSSSPSGITFAEEVNAGAWWTSFGNPTINAWVEKALRKSPNARMAKATLDQASAQLDSAESNLYPQVTLGLGANRSSTLKTPLIAAGDKKDAPTNLYTLYNASINVSYVFDFFGGVRRGVESKLAQYEAAQWEWQGAMNTLAGNIITAGINLASVRAQTRDTEIMLNLQEKQLASIEAQRRVGTVSDVEVANAQLSVASTRTQLPSLRKQQRALENQVAVMLGEFPSESWTDGVDLNTLSVPSSIPLWIPSSLVRNRPDIRLAQAQYKMANANVGLAESQYYPQVGISGSITSQALSAANILNTTLWSAGASIVQTLFKGGQLTSQTAQANAALDFARARYEQTVLNAFGNVSNVLTALEQDVIAVKAQNDALQAAERAYRLAQNRYRVGTISLYEQILVERAYQQARISQIQSVATKLANVAALYLAAGGNTDFSALGLTVDESAPSAQ